MRQFLTHVAQSAESIPDSTSEVNPLNWPNRNPSKLIQISANTINCASQPEITDFFPLFRYSIIASNALYKLGELGDRILDTCIFVEASKIANGKYDQDETKRKQRKTPTARAHMFD